MKIGDVVYLKSGGPAMTVVKSVDDGWLTNWFTNALYSGVFPEAALTTDNPEPAIAKATEALRQSV